MRTYEQRMSKCPKCGSYSVLGPQYQRGRQVVIDGPMVDGECLRWYCDRCGYEEYTACRDAAD